MYSVEELQKIIEAEIISRSKQLLEQNPVELYEPISYSLEMGGKRLRPVLLLLAYNLFSEDVIPAVPAALAIEVFHNFTLLHDDIMDKADVRRNRQTVHVKFSENSAILSGDAMAFQSYKYLVECKSKRLVEALELFTKTAIEVCEGQQFDMDFENRMDVTVDEYLEMIRLKTAVLLACSLKAGAVLANASAEVANQLYEFGINLGLSFQLQDDLLDTFGDQKTFGKKIGGDILANKKTFLLINALENASEAQNTELLNWIEKSVFHPDEKIEAVTGIYKQLGIKQLAEEKVDFYFKKAVACLEAVQLEDVIKQPLRELANKMLIRRH
ncbi:polyprenyl synthetase family protein [Prolixibacteraceae bacterium Z1-6]|uniref:Polyprenyl synthetase family protein n=1 Tax=Draconibacterium aestuarii TaxID=2998507 RepID=A0A9X3F952_9BACT|nr:polyprenyl synthetase family protein [Prolixibacteraceae bacterium Z1-6]